MTLNDRNADGVGPTLGGSVHFEDRDDGAVQVTVVGSTSPEHAVVVAQEAAMGQALVGDWKRAVDGAVACVETADSYRLLFVPFLDSGRR